MIAPHLGHFLALHGIPFASSTLSPHIGQTHSVGLPGKGLNIIIHLI